MKISKYHTADERANEAPKFHLISRSWMQCTEAEKHDWEWLQLTIGLRDRKMKTQGGDVVTVTMIRRMTGSGPWVLRGHNWPVQGFDGLNAAQLSQPLDSTPTFQLYIYIYIYILACRGYMV